MKIEFKGKRLKEVGVVKENNSKYINFKKGKVVIRVSEEYFRPTEVDILVANSDKAKSLLNWNPTTNLESLIDKMLKKDLNEFEIKKIVKDQGYFVSNNKLDD